MCATVGVGACPPMNAAGQRGPEESVRFFGARVTGDGESPSMVAGNN